MCTMCAMSVCRPCLHLHYQLEHRYIHRIFLISIVYFNYLTWKISTVLHFVRNYIISQVKDMWLSQPTQHTPLASATTSLRHECTMCAMWQKWRKGRRGKWTRVSKSYPGLPGWLDSSQTQPTDWTVWLTAVMEWRPVWKPTPQSPHVRYTNVHTKRIIYSSNFQWK